MQVYSGRRADLVLQVCANAQEPSGLSYAQLRAVRRRISLSPYSCGYISTSCLSSSPPDCHLLTVDWKRAHMGADRPVV